jgi:beta-hydroxyacyl-ACP dehydratase FabZ
MALMDIEQIMKILPHRYPFLLVDQVLECDGKERIVGIKNLTINEPFFQGHFPGHPVLPGVLQMEAMAQVGGILLNQITKKEGQIAYFLAIDAAKFRRVCVPGDQLRIEVKFTRARLGMCRVHGTIHVGGEMASEADLMFGYRSE